MKERLISTLAEVGHPPTEMTLGAGSALILPYGGRVLGLFTSGGVNLFWTNPALTDIAGAQAFFASDGWKNSGGDRTWLSPEIELFVRDLNAFFESYSVPSALDPGHYVMRREGEGVTLTNRATVALHHLEKKCAFALEKTIRPIPNPLRRDKDAHALLREVEYLGYEQTTTLYLLSSPEAGLQVGLWSLVQVPAGGELLIPTVRRSRPRDYFAPTGESHLQVTERLIRFRLDAREQHKIGVQATDVWGRAAYLRPVGDRHAALLVRNFAVDPSGEYVDVPWDERDDFGYAVQSYNDDGSIGDFGELEYHAPAIDAERTRSHDRSQLWGFFGETAPIRDVCERLIGVAP